MASTYLTRTPSSTTNQKTWTVSCWVKRCLLTSTQMIWGVNGDSSGNYFTELNFNSGDQLEFRQGGTVGDPYQTQMLTNARYRDTNGWYHIVVAADTTQATEANRLKIYINGEQITSWAIANYPSQNENFRWNYTGYAHSIGRSGQDNARYFDGCISHFHSTDGTQYAASTFGETDATTGIWKPKTAPSVTYGTNGFFLKFENSGAMGTDSSGNSNTFSVNGSMTQLIDTPSNVFATLNPLIPFRGTPTFQSANTYFRSDYGNWDSALSTIGATSGKYYFEAKWGNQNNLMIGCVDINKDPEFAGGGHTYGYVGYRGISYFGETSNPRVIGNNNNDLVTGLTTFASGDIIGCAIDLDNREMFVHRNGTYTNSGNPATRANPYNMATSINQGGFVLMGVASRSGYGIEVNFGNGYFSTTAVSSAQNPDDGIGIFEYSVPSGYKALCTKSINAQEYS